MLFASGSAAGIIPAYAGSTPCRGPPHMLFADHPRIRGEHEEHPTASPSTEGSSPHTRGARQKILDELGAKRIIPAYAGSTPRPMGLTISRWDHPRIRGEHAEADGPHYFPVGSSPHTRGARRSPFQSSPFRGIIPAYAGSTSGLPPAEWRRADHPRIRGEHAVEGGFVDGVQGSSPHTRGARRLPDPGLGRGGIIPAYAGSTTHPQCSRRARWDHPRIRGEHVPPCGVSVQPSGSSPHTRGARAPAWCISPRSRIIPAYAGSTCRHF